MHMPSQGTKLTFRERKVVHLFRYPTSGKLWPYALSTEYVRGPDPIDQTHWS